MEMHALTMLLRRTLPCWRLCESSVLVQCLLHRAWSGWSMEWRVFCALHYAPLRLHAYGMPLLPQRCSARDAPWPMDWKALAPG